MSRRKKKNTKRLLLVLLVIIGGIVWLIFSRGFPAENALPVTNGAAVAPARTGTAGLSVSSSTPLVTTTTTTKPAEVAWNIFNDAQDCYAMNYPSWFSNTTSSDSSVVSLVDSAAPAEAAMKIQINTLPMPDGFSFDSFIARENAAILEDNKDAQPEDILNLVYELVVLNAFKYRQHTFTGPGGKFDAYMASSIDGKNYYQVLVWGGKNDSSATLSKILTSFAPQACEW